MDLKVSKWVGNGYFRHQDIVDDFTTIEAAETAHETAENNRVTAEATRITNETNRVNDENSRVAAENERVITYNNLINKNTIFTSTEPPLQTDGSDGNIWFQYVI